MPRHPIATGLVALSLGAALCGLAPAGAQDAPTASLPLRDVVLFSSGVGYFARGGRVQGEGSVELSLRPGRLDDILKSLVLFDPQGQVRPVTYAALDEHAGSPGIRPDRNATLGGILRGFQGARARLEAGGAATEGRIVSVSLRTATGLGAGFNQSEVLNLLTETGLRAIPLENVSEVRLLDERLDADLRRGLEALARGFEEERKRVTLRFAGGQAREVRVGYLQETPVWKTSYRLALDRNQAPYLQGWAIVENTTEEDWKDVRLSLVSGRPVSFIQDLSQPLYVPRPTVEAQVIGSPNPQTYSEVVQAADRPNAVGGGGGLGGGLGGGMMGGFGGGGLGGVGGGFGPGGGFPGAGPGDRKISLNLRGVRLREAVAQLFQGTGMQYAVEPNVPNVPITLNVRDISVEAALRLILRYASSQVPGLTLGREGEVFLVRVRQAAPPAMDADEPAPDLDFARERREDVAASAARLAQSVASQAQGTERGALFEYAIRQAVDLPKGQAAMVPIVTGKIAGERLSIYDPDADGRHALHSFRLKNDTSLHLAGGPITVFREGIYAGDAQIGNVQPGEERLLSYAVDLDLVIDRETPSAATELVSVKADAGILQVTRKQRREQLYTFRNKSDEAKTVVVQQDQERDFKLVEPAKGVERTPDEYRFTVSVPAKGNAALKVVTERPLSEKIALLDARVDLLSLYAQDGRISEKVRAALKQQLERRRKIAELQEQRAAVEAELKEIDREQSRIRQNMGQLDRNSPLYQDYVKKLTAQERRIETLRADLARLLVAEGTALKELEEFLRGLSVE